MPAILISKENAFKQKAKIVLLAFFILAATFFSFLPSLSNGFINWDDSLYVVENEIIRELSFENLGRIFTSFHAGLYKPLVFLSFAIEYHFFELDPFVYHATNLAFHLLNCLLVFWLIFLISSRLGVSFVAAMLFGLHPLHVESVAWVAERKDMLYAFFFLLSLVGYACYQRVRARRYYFIALAAFALSLLAKPNGVALPVVLLILDFLRRRPLNKKVLLEKAPFFALSAVILFVSMVGLRSDPKVEHLPLAMNLDGLFIAAHGIVFYLKKTLLPVGLSCFYPYPLKSAGLLPFAFLFSPVVVILLAAGVAASRRYTKKVIFGSLFFFVSVLPVLPLGPVGPGIAAADRYTYVPSIGLFYMAAEFFFWIVRRSRGFRYGVLFKGVLVVALALILSTLAFLTRQRVKVWKDGITLWTDVLESSPDFLVARLNRGIAHYEKGDLEAAFFDFRRAIEIYPRFAEAYYNLGVVYDAQGRSEKAMSAYDRAIKENPDYGKAYYNRAVLYAQQGGLDEALIDYSRAIQADPRDANAYLNRGGIHLIQGRLRQAIVDSGEAIAIDPRLAEAYYNRGYAYAMQSEFDGAICDFTRAIEINQNYALAYKYRGFAYFYKGEYSGSWADIGRAQALGEEVDSVFIADLEAASGINSPYAIGKGIN